MSDAYKPQDSMGLWWLGEGTGQQSAPRLIGQVFLAEGNVVVKDHDLEQMAQYIDDPTLQPQRVAFRTQKHPSQV